MGNASQIQEISPIVLMQKQDTGNGAYRFTFTALSSETRFRLVRRDEDGSGQQNIYLDHIALYQIRDTSYNDTTFLATSNGYRYGFNGKEYDNEVYGIGAFQDYGARTYNILISRFPSVDTMFRSYPMLTPYQFASLSPIQGVDLDGNELKKVVHYVEQQADGKLYVVKTEVTIDKDKKYMDKRDASLLAKTEVYFVFKGEKFSEPAKINLEPAKSSDGMKASANYDYTIDNNKEKEKDDQEYLDKASNIFVRGWRHLKLALRDMAAEDNHADEQTIELLDLKTRKSNDD